MPAKIDSKVANSVMKEANLKPLTPYVNSFTPWESMCLKCKSLVTPTLSNVKRYGAGCWNCGVEKRIDSKRTPEVEAIKKMQKAGLEPLESYTNNSTPWKCQCKKCKKFVSPIYAVIARGGGGCKWCGIEKTRKKRKFPDENAASLMISKGLKPLEKYPGSSKPWKCECLSCGSIAFPNYSNTRRRNESKYGCIYCAGMKVHTKVVEVMMVKAGVKPLEKYQGMDVPWKSKCLVCKNIVFPTAGNIKRGQGGCSFCRETGLNYQEPSYIYVIFHEKYQSIKIGVSNNDSKPNRLKAHQKQGWTTYKVRNYTSGEKAESVETKVLRWLRKERNLGRHLSSRHMPQGGHSETVDASEIDLPTIWAKVQEFSKVKR